MSKKTHSYGQAIFLNQQINQFQNLFQKSKYLMYIKIYNVSEIDFIFKNIIILFCFFLLKIYIHLFYNKIAYNNNSDLNAKHFFSGDFPIQFL